MEYLSHSPKPNIASSQVWFWDAESCACPLADMAGKFGFDLNWLRFFEVSYKMLIHDGKRKYICAEIQVKSPEMKCMYTYQGMAFKGIKSRNMTENRNISIAKH